MTSEEKGKREVESALRHALRREDPTAGFAERVLAKIPAQELQLRWWRRWMISGNTHALRYATAMVLVVAVVLGALGYKRHERERREGEAARQQVLLALRIASSKLQYAQAKVIRAGEGPMTVQHGKQGTEER